MNRARQLAVLERGTTPDQALAFFDSLPPVDEASMMGFWRGTELPTGHALDGLLSRCGWRGKRFESVSAVHPLVFERSDGQLVSVRAGRLLEFALRHPALFNNAAGAAAFRLMLRLGVLSTTRPQATLRTTEARGVESATMVYDRMAAQDSFRAVDDDTVVGCMRADGVPEPLVFVLRRA